MDYHTALRKLHGLVEVTGSTVLAEIEQAIAADVGVLRTSQTTIEALRRRLELLVAYAVTCLLKNQPEWMEGLEQHVNEALKAVGDTDRVHWDGKRFRVVRH